MDTKAIPKVSDGKAVDVKLPLLPSEIQKKLKYLHLLVEGVRSSNPVRQLSYATQIRKLLSIERDPPIQQVIDSGVTSRLVEFLADDGNTPLQYEAAWALTNLVSGTSTHTRVVLHAGALPHLIRLLRSPSEDVRGQVVWAVGNIAGDSPELRDIVLKAGALTPLLDFYTVANTISAVAPALPRLATLLRLEDEEVLTDVCWSLSYLSDDRSPRNQQIEAVISAGVCKRLVQLLGYKNAAVKGAALRAVANILTGEDQHTKDHECFEIFSHMGKPLDAQVIMDHGALPHLNALLIDPRKGIRKEACWAISNITAGSADHIQAVIDANIVAPLLEVIKKDAFEIHKEAVWAIVNAIIGGLDEQIRYLVDQNVIPFLCNVLTCDDVKMVMAVLNGIDDILDVGRTDANGKSNLYAQKVEECGGLDRLEALQYHPDDSVYEKVSRLLNAYYEVDYDTIEQIVTSSTAPAGETSVKKQPVPISADSSIDVPTLS